MSTITRERLEQLANFRGAPVTRQEEQQLARIVLALHEAVPVAYADPQAFRNFRAGAARREWMWRNPGADLIPVYTTPSAPVSVPDFGALTKCIVQRLVDYGAADDDAIASAEEFVYNACRDAMLQGDEPSKMSGIMPDYEGGVMTQREFFQAGWEAHHAAMLQAGAPVQFGWSKGHFGYHTLFNAICKAVNIQGGALSISVSAFEDAMLAAAPQQEVK